MAELSTQSKSWRTPLTLLVLMSIAMPVAFNAWLALLNNFVVERAAFTGVEIGILQSLREVPGFMAFTTVFVLLILKEQTFAVLALALMGLGVALTGLFPFAYGLYFTTLLMSVGFHYFEAVKQSLSLQWLDPAEAPRVLGRLIAVGSVTSLVVYAALWLLLQVLEIDYIWLFVLAGVVCMGLAVFMQVGFPHFPSKAQQHKHLVLRKRYWLYYALTFFSGARRQIFMVFAAFLMVEKFGYTAAEVTLLFLINYAFNWLFAERIGRLISRIGERLALTIEYVGLILVFTGYAFVENAYLAAGLYVVDHMFFALAIAITTYFQKIADPADLASSAGVSFTINHIAAVVVPAVLGLVWIYSPMVVFLIGTGFAVSSLLLSQNIPARPAPGNETLVGKVASAQGL
ncbi:MAG: MFS transporter [Pseudomonadales bacterium]|nr:MFS transporter [Pseudomonadales bacterium]MDP6472502.1 MFS transporter [Pseudomonadales bacterium]MDP6828687.1 MFS transporter [Pseudomonadales bacterium]MDP6970407.1 MFS transporter [Pseudomonadales bacterium]